MGEGRSAVQLLRQLGIAFSTYRLYPGDLNQSTLVAAVARIEEAATAALAAGPVDAVVRAGRFQLGGEPVDDDRADRLADACFQRRVEHLQIRSTPTLAELDALFDALVRSPADVEAAGGVDALLAARGVGSLAASERAPDPVSGRTAPDADVAVVERPEPDAAAQDPDAGLPPLPAVEGETALDLYERLRAISDSLPDHVIARSSFFRRAAVLATGLPDPEPTTFAAHVLERAVTEAFAERYVGHLTDLDLARLVADVAQARGEDAVGLAAETATLTGRHDALVRLVEAAVADAASRARVGEALPPPAGEGTAPAAPEARRLRDDFPADGDEGRQQALMTLRDYLRSEPDAAQTERVAAAATHQLRTDVREHAPGRLRELLNALEAAAPHTTAEVRALVTTPRRQALTSEVLAELAEGTRSGDAAAVANVLEPFGADAVGALLDALAEESRRTVRGLLVGLLAALVTDDPARLKPHLGDPRWFVARNIASALRRVGGTAVVPLLESLAVHPHEAVRQEALHGLASLPPDHAAPALARLTAAHTRRDDREACLRALGGFESPAAAELLEELGSRHARSPLPWSLRRQARALARRIRGA